MPDLRVCLANEACCELMCREGCLRSVDVGEGSGTSDSTGETGAGPRDTVVTGEAGADEGNQRCFRGLEKNV